MLYKGGATTDGLVSLIIYLANKGYLKIREDDFGYNIEQVKSYDGMNHTEKAFISALVPADSLSVKCSLNHLLISINLASQL